MGSYKKIGLSHETGLTDTASFQPFFTKFRKAGENS